MPILGRGRHEVLESARESGYIRTCGKFGQLRRRRAGGCHDSAARSEPQMTQAGQNSAFALRCPRIPREEGASCKSDPVVDPLVKARALPSAMVDGSVTDHISRPERSGSRGHSGLERAWSDLPDLRRKHRMVTCCGTPSGNRERRAWSGAPVLARLPGPPLEPHSRGTPICGCARRVHRPAPGGP